jgi:hypothetical protein
MSIGGACYRNADGYFRGYDSFYDQRGFACLSRISGDDVRGLFQDDSAVQIKYLFLGHFESVRLTPGPTSIT